MANILIDLIGLIVVIILSYFGGELVGRLNLPKVLGYLFVGMVIGPYALGLVDPEAFNFAIYKIILILAVGLVGHSFTVHTYSNFHSEVRR